MLIALFCQLLSVKSSHSLSALTPNLEVNVNILVSYLAS